MPTIGPKGPAFVPASPDPKKPKEPATSPAEISLPETSETGKTTDPAKLNKLNADAKADSVFKHVSDLFKKKN